MSTYEEFKTGIATLKEFCLLRAENIRGQLEGTIGSTLDTQENDTLIDAGDLQINDMGSMGNMGNMGNKASIDTMGNKANMDNMGNKANMDNLGDRIRDRQVEKQWSTRHTLRFMESVSGCIHCASANAYFVGDKRWE